MARPTTTDDLETLRQKLKIFAQAAAATTLVGIVASIVLLQPGAGTGPADVHVPEASLGLLQGIPDFDAAVHIAGGAIAEWQNRLGRLLISLGYVAMVVIVWALVKRRKSAAKIAFFCLIAFSILRPVSPPMQINPPRAVSAETARQLLARAAQAGPGDNGSPARRYVLAQIAFLEGDGERAGRLSAGLTGAALASPIEAPFRLQFLQNVPPERTTVCYTTGCFGETMRQAAQVAIGLLALLALALGIAAIRLRAMLRLRCERIELLRGALFKRRRVAA